jgi:hypothetical protein
MTNAPAAIMAHCGVNAIPSAQIYEALGPLADARTSTRRRGDWIHREIAALRKDNMIETVGEKDGRKIFRLTNEGVSAAGRAGAA